uniref:Uncharacterized protein n=1 Tax=Anguilla anguilla TaxID=7936 RepID=A0A0E9RC62_ANGAN
MWTYLQCISKSVSL